MSRLAIEAADLSCQTIAVLTWAWLVANYQVPVVATALVTIALIVSFVRSFERTTCLLTDYAMLEGDDHG